MQLPILGTIPTKVSISFLAKSASQSEAYAKSSVEPNAKAASPSKAPDGAYPTPLVAAETKAALLALQEEAAPESAVQSVHINGLSIIVAGHSVDERDGVSLLRTLSPSDTRAMMDIVAAMDDDAESAEGAASKSASDIIRLDKQGFLMEVETEALEALPDGATFAYMNEDFTHSRGRWTNENPLELSNSERSIAEDRRVRLETLMNSVDAERQLRAKYGQDVKLVYSHVDKSYIMLTPDDAKYDMMKSAESGVKDVINEVHRGFMDKKTAVDILKRYGYHI